MPRRDFESYHKEGRKAFANGKKQYENPYTAAYECRIRSWLYTQRKKYNDQYLSNHLSALTGTDEFLRYKNWHNGWAFAASKSSDINQSYCLEVSVRKIFNEKYSRN